MRSPREYLRFGVDVLVFESEFMAGPDSSPFALIGSMLLAFSSLFYSLLVDPGGFVNSKLS